MDAADTLFLPPAPNDDSTAPANSRRRGSQVVVSLDTELLRMVAEIADGEGRSSTIRRMLRFAARHMPRHDR